MGQEQTLRSSAGQQQLSGATLMMRWRLRVPGSWLVKQQQAVKANDAGDQLVGRQVMNPVAGLADGKGDGQRWRCQQHSPVRSVHQPLFHRLPRCKLGSI